MTPAEQFAQKRAEAVILIQQHAPPRLQKSLIRLLRPAIALNVTRCDDDSIPIGASKFGGAPDVAAGFEWPQWNDKPLGFLAQINLEEVAPFDLEGLLPKRGLLSFFMALDEDDPVWGEPEQRESWRVVWFDKVLSRRTPPTDSHWVVAQNPHSVAFEFAWPISQDGLNSLDFEWDEASYSELQWEVLVRHPHRMLAPPYAPQLSPFVVASNGVQGKTGFDLYDESVATDDWILLLQLDTGSGEFFEDIHDVGWLYFMIRREDLRNGDFSKVWLNEQCT